jgi:hypothetical protein
MDNRDLSKIVILRVSAELQQALNEHRRKTLTSTSEFVRQSVMAALERAGSAK